MNIASLLLLGSLSTWKWGDGVAIMRGQVNVSLSMASSSNDGLSTQEPRQAITRVQSPFSTEAGGRSASDLSTDDDGFALEPCDYISDDFDNDDDAISCFRIPQLTVDEKKRLLFGIKRYGPGNLDLISRLLPDRNMLQIANYISTLHHQSKKPKTEPLRFGYPSDEDDTSTSYTQSSATISECESSDSAFNETPKKRIQYDRDLNSVINWDHVKKRFRLPNDDSLEIVSVQIIHSFITYMRELVRNVASLSSAIPHGSNPIITTDIIHMALVQCQSLSHL